MSIDFSKVKSLTIPEGNVTKITRNSDGKVLWELASAPETPPTPTTYNVSYALGSFMCVPNPTTINPGEAFVVSIMPRAPGATISGYTVTMGGVNVEYPQVQINEARTNVAINIPSVTGDISIIVW